MKTVDVSGMGGGYENHCQQMIKAAMEKMDELGVPNDEEIESANSDRYKAIEEAMMVACNRDATGASFFSSFGHAYHRKVKGDEWYFDQFKDNPDRVYEWDGTVASCPVTDLSKQMEAEEKQ
jgi:hypothetical protein